MTYIGLTVHRSGRIKASTPRIQITGDWLKDIGFVNHALVQIIPKPQGLSLNLRNENIRSYSDLYEKTEELGGTLVRVFISNTRTLKGPTFVIQGKYLLSGGLKIGDRTIAKCEKGQITLRKLDDDMRLINISKRNDRNTGEPIPSVNINANWLTEVGFSADTLYTLSSEPGEITLTILDSSITYTDACKLARANKCRLLKVGDKRGAPILDFAGTYVARTGFEIGEMVIAELSQGAIKLQKFEPHKFGF